VAPDLLSEREVFDMGRVAYESGFLRSWIRGVAETPVHRPAPLPRPPQTTYEETFRWHLGPGDRPNLFLYRASEIGRAASDERDGLSWFDAVLIDGQYGYEWVRHELAERGARVRPGGTILVHRTRGGFDRALLALHAWAADPSVSIRWPHASSLAVAKVFEDLRAAVLDGRGGERGHGIELRDLREDFEHEAVNDSACAGGAPPREAQSIATRSMLVS
jgi:hypothetical protein